MFCLIVLIFLAKKLANSLHFSVERRSGFDRLGAFGSWGWGCLGVDDAGCGLDVIKRQIVINNYCVWVRQMVNAD